MAAKTAHLWTLPGRLVNRCRAWWSGQQFPARATWPDEAAPWFWPGLAVLVIVAGYLLFGRLGYPLLEPDEGRYAEVAREMLVRGDWIVPTVNGKPFYDKPPLFYWLVAASYQIFGVTDWAARLVPTLAAFLTVLTVYVLGRRSLGTRGAFLGGLALALMPGPVLCGRVVILDSLLTFFVAVTLLTAHAAIGPRSVGVGWRWWLLSAVGCGLGVMTKGPIAGVLLLPPLVLYLILNADRARPTCAQWTAYLAVVLALVVPWFAAIIVRDPHFAYHFFVDQHLVRFALKAYHVEPMWYYVPVLLAACLPWSLLVIPFGRFLLSRSDEVRAVRCPALGFFALWAGWCVLFFSLSSSKLPPYVLPAAPALALLFGAYVDRLALRSSPRLVVAALACLWIGASVVGWRMQLLSGLAAWLQVALGGICLFFLAWRGRQLTLRPAWLLCGFLGFVLVSEVAQGFIPAWAHRRAPLEQHRSAVARFLADGSARVVCLGGEWGSIPFYLQRDDVVNCNDWKPEEYVPRLSTYARYLLVLRHASDLETFRTYLIPPGRQVERVLTADQIGLAFVTTVPPGVESRHRRAARPR